MSDDRELVARFVANADEHSFRRLYSAYTPRLYLSLLRLCGGRDSEAEDLLQETWIRAARSLGAFRWQSALSTWLHGIALNVWRETVRAARVPELSTTTLHNEPTDAPTDANDGEAALDLKREVRRLPDGYREVLVLHDVEGHTHDEIAGMLGITAGTSKSQLSRAREHLRHRLSPAPAHHEKEKHQ